ncbi:MAG: acyl-CoA thioesterase [Bacteroides sp.]|nr:acyl-CoA thioesterase [Bacteroides sp.]MCM1413701.1 acyl-CoA thioesterase [Bacteroides sp.]MCM1471880.1 acyl-CoA thioesterase [Bacteroides sp.]
MSAEEKKYQFEMPMRVRDYEVDSQGIVNNAVYLHYLEHTRHEFCRCANTSFRAMQEQGIDPVIREITIKYLHPLGLGQEFVSCLSLRRCGARFVFVQDVYTLPDRTPVVEAECTVVCLEDGRLTRGDVLAEAFAYYLQQ